ncbi:MAG TPA: SDR family oxidoreductase [Bacteroidetes bacterium]|nr:SDR family oxidoreductase [Bacteroidota bacterium]
MQSFRNKTAVITGAASGIGQHLAVQLAGRGAFVVMADIDEKGLAMTFDIIKKSGGRASSHVVDVSKKEQVHALANEVAGTHDGHIDIVINNAGVALQPLKIEELTYEEIEWLLGINLWGVIYGTKAFLPHLKKRPEASLVNMSSVFGLSGIPGQGPYCISKFGVRGFTETLRAELLDEKNMHVMVVHPGGIKTNIAKNARHRCSSEEEKTLFDKRFEQNAHTTPQEAARQIIRGIEKRKPRIRIGRDALWMDRLYRLTPTRAVSIFADMLKKFDEGKKVW